MAAVAPLAQEGSARDPAPEVPPPSVITPIPRTLGADPARAALGQALFSDPALSRRGDRSCRSCHDIGGNGAGAAARGRTVDGAMLARNTPTAFNAALSFRLGWEGDIATLEQQADLALTDPRFLGGAWSAILERVRTDLDLAARFGRSYGRPPDREAVLDAIASFERTLLTPDSRFDDWLRGDEHAITDAERSGYELFRGIGCAACHQGVNVGANLYEKVGIFATIPNRSAETLRVPSLRNVAVTAPYFDDGGVATLPEAVRLMGRMQLGRELTDAQAASIVAFLGTLTGSYEGRRLAAPRAPSADPHGDPPQGAGRSRP